MVSSSCKFSTSPSPCDPEYIRAPTIDEWLSPIVCPISWRSKVCRCVSVEEGEESTDRVVLLSILNDEAPPGPVPVFGNWPKAKVVELEKADGRAYSMWM